MYAGREGARGFVMSLSEAVRGPRGPFGGEMYCLELLVGGLFLRVKILYFVSGRAIGVHWVGVRTPDGPLEGFFVN